MIKPTEPIGCLEKDWQKYAQDNAKWSDWIAEHPERASAASPLPEAAGVPAPSSPFATEPAQPIVQPASTVGEQRPDGTAPMAHKHRFDPETGMPIP